MQPNGTNNEKKGEREYVCMRECVCVCVARERERERERDVCEASSRVNGSTKNLQQKS